MTEREIQNQLRAIKAMMASPGWQIVKQRLDEEIKSLATNMAASPTMSPDDMHFRRGAIKATLNMMSLPNNILILLEGELAQLQLQKPKDKTNGE